MCRRPRHRLWRSVGNMQHGGHSELGELVNNSHQSISQSFVEGRSSSAGGRNEGWRSEGDPSSPTWCLKHAAWMHRRMHTLSACMHTPLPAERMPHEACGGGEGSMRLERKMPRYRTLHWLTRDTSHSHCAGAAQSSHCAATALSCAVLCALFTVQSLYFAIAVLQGQCPAQPLHCAALHCTCQA